MVHDGEVAYRIDPAAPTPSEVRRVLREQVLRGAGALRVEGGPDAEAVHDVRKRLKKARSVLRLARADLGATVRHHANVELRGVGAALAGQRDADAMVETADRLLQVAPEGPTEAAVRDLRRWLAADADRLRAAGGLSRSVAIGSAQTLERTSTWLDAVPPRAEGWKALAVGFGRQYAKGRKAFAGLGPDPTDDQLHQWRKRAKDLWYHQRLLRNLWPEAQRPIMEAASHLSDVLGDDHDLAVLVGRLTGDGAESMTDRNLVVRLAGAERARLQAEARLLGARLYADEPKPWVARHGAWWAVANGSAA